MAWKDNIKNREFDKFIELPAGETAVRTAPVLSNPLPTDNVGATNIRITNLVVDAANTEKTHALVANLKKIIIRNRSESNMKICFVSGESSVNYFTVRRGTVFVLSDMTISETLYYQSDKLSTVEVIEQF